MVLVAAILAGTVFLLRIKKSWSELANSFAYIRFYLVMKSASLWGANRCHLFEQFPRICTYISGAGPWVSHLDAFLQQYVFFVPRNAWVAMLCVVEWMHIGAALVRPGGRWGHGGYGVRGAYSNRFHASLSDGVMVQLSEGQGPIYNLHERLLKIAYYSGPKHCAIVPSYYTLTSNEFGDGMCRKGLVPLKLAEAQDIILEGHLYPLGWVPFHPPYYQFIWKNMSQLYLFLDLWWVQRWCGGCGALPPPGPGHRIVRMCGI